MPEKRAQLNPYNIPGLGSVGGAALRTGVAGALAGGLGNAAHSYHTSDATGGERLQQAGIAGLKGALVGGTAGAGLGAGLQQRYRTTAVNDLADQAFRMGRLRNFVVENAGTNTAKDFANRARAAQAGLNSSMRGYAERPNFWNGLGKKAMIETRLKKRQRGFYYEPDPGFHDVNGKFDDAHAKTKQVKLAAIMDTLARFGLKLSEKQAGQLLDSPDPAKALTQILKTDDFGLGLEPGKGAGPGEQRKPKDFSAWGPKSGLGGGGAAEGLMGGNMAGSFGGA
jgi:hypothetical protein